MGDWVASPTAVERGAALVRWGLVAVVAVSSAELLGVFDLAAHLF